MVTNDETAGGIPRVLVRVAGAGMRARRVRTDLFGTARFTLRPARRGVLVISATKSGYRRATARLRVR
jgi:hypothetical protein